MAQLVYETHIINDPLIPIITHIDTREAGEKYAPNWHINLELLLCISGEGKVNCEGVEYSFSEGDLFVVNSNELHSVYSDSEVRYYCLIVDRDFCKENGIDTDYVRFCEVVKNETVAEKFRKVCDVYSASDICRGTRIRCAVLELLIDLRISYTESRIGSGESERDPGIERIKKAIMYIRQNLAKTFTLDEIADYVGISKFYLTREFKRITGQTLFEHINVVRCKEAKRLIAEGMSVSEAARSCGYENMSYFSRTYKKCIGTLPTRRRLD